MKYFVKYLLDGTYKMGDKFSAVSGKETEATKEVFDYLNSTYGDSGWFTFKKEGTETKAKTKVAPKAKAKVEPKAEPKEKVTKKESK